MIFKTVPLNVFLALGFLLVTGLVCSGFGSMTLYPKKSKR